MTNITIRATNQVVPILCKSLNPDCLVSELIQFIQAKPFAWDFDIVLMMDYGAILDPYEKLRCYGMKDCGLALRLRAELVKRKVIPQEKQPEPATAKPVVEEDSEAEMSEADASTDDSTRSTSSE